MPCELDIERLPQRSRLEEIGDSLWNISLISFSSYPFKRSGSTVHAWKKKKSNEPKARMKEEGTNLLVKSLNELIAEAFEQFPNLETIIRPFSSDTLHVLVKLVHAILISLMLADKGTHVPLLLENGKEDVLERMLLVATKRPKGAQTIPGEIGFIARPDAGSGVVDGVERANEGVSEELGLDAVRGWEVRVKVAVCGAGDWDERVAVFLV